MATTSEDAILTRAIKAVSVFDREHVEEGPWEVVGPIMAGTLSFAPGTKSVLHDAGYGIRAVEPKKFGGTVVVASGLTKAFAEQAVKVHAEAIKPAYAKPLAPEQPAKKKRAKGKKP